MSESLGTYLNDHLGGAQVALQLLAAMRDQHDDQHFRNFAAQLLPEVQEDDGTLRSILGRVHGSPSSIKAAGGWLLEKAARLKLGHTGSTDLELFESLELLALGIHGKLCLWKTLQVAASGDARLRDYDFDRLILRATEQRAIIEAERLNLARRIFTAVR